METAAVPQTFVECCQWSSEIDQDHNGVVEELRRIHFLDEEREEYQGRFKTVEDEIQRLLDELRMWTACSMDAKKCSMITSFVDKIVWSWQDGRTWIRYEANQLKMNCVHKKKSIHETYRFLFASKMKPSWHPECVENFNRMHDVIIPKLSRLLQCDNILHELNYFKQATLYRQHQLKEIQSFTATHLQIPDTTIPHLLTTPSTDNTFAPICKLLTGELFGTDPLEISVPSPKVKQTISFTYREPLSYQAFKSLPAPISQSPVSQLPKGRPGRPTSDAQGYGDVASYAPGLEMGAKGPKVPTKKRGPYKKRDKPVVVTCELVKVRNSAEALTPIKIPKLRGDLMMPLN